MSTLANHKTALFKRLISFQKFLPSSPLFLFLLCPPICADYDQMDATQIDPLINQTQRVTDDVDIQQVGHSPSVNELAPEASAAARADAEKLMANNLPSQNNPASEPQLTTNQLAVTTAVVMKNEEENISDPDSESCAKVTFTKGSLADNIKREIGHCGYVMGNWGFGSKDDLIDWDIPFQYSTYVDDEIIGLLELVESNYEIRAHIHKLDKSIDFLPSIKDRRSYE